LSRGLASCSDTARATLNDAGATNGVVKTSERVSSPTPVLVGIAQSPGARLAEHSRRGAGEVDVDSVLNATLREPTARGIEMTPNMLAGQKTEAREFLIRKLHVIFSESVALVLSPATEGQAGRPRASASGATSPSVDGLARARIPPYSGRYLTHR
jgi:hypothetical protein